jgi:hypothetical protein
MMAFAAAAWGQNSNFVKSGRDCGNPSAIFGTAGFANLQAGVDTNANTYSAAAFAERLGVEQRAKDADGERALRGFVVWEVNETFDVARVPTFHPRVAEVQQPDCDPEFRVAMRGADLQATQLAGVFGSRHFGGFFAASQTSGQVTSTDNLLRMTNWGYLYPLYSTVPLVLSPFFAGQGRSGTTVFTLDAVYGAWLDTQWVVAKAGYTKSSGLFATARDTTVGLFATAVVRPEDGSVPVLRAGIQKFDPGRSFGDRVSVFGMPSAYYRDLPLAAPAGLDATTARHERLRTAHVELEDVGRMFDAVTTFRASPEPALSEATLSIHHPDYHLRPGDDPDQGQALLSAGGGMVQLLEQPSLGVEGGRYASARVQLGYRTAGSAVWLLLHVNDAEQLALYPFARNALSTQLHVEVSKW